MGTEIVSEEKQTQPMGRSPESLGASHSRMYCAREDSRVTRRGCGYRERFTREVSTHMRVYDMFKHVLTSSVIDRLMSGENVGVKFYNVGNTLYLERYDPQPRKSVVPSIFFRFKRPMFSDMRLGSTSGSFRTVITGTFAHPTYHYEA